jgi:transmembrane sensor
MTPSDEEIRAAIARQAGEWFIANQEDTLSSEEGAVFLAWLKASPIHVREYLGVARIAHHLPAAVGQPQVPLETFLAQQRLGDDSLFFLDTPASRQRPPAPHRAALQAWPVAASLLALAVGVLWWAHDGELFGIPKTYRTAHGEQSLQRLPDGSMLRLDTESEATVRYSASERVVQVNRGQALFEVAHEDRRRFRIAAGNAGAIAVGTRFDVYRKASSIEFTVAEGVIVVFAGQPSWVRSPSALPPDAVQHVTAGYQVHIDSGGLSAQPVPVDLNQTLGWLQHKIVFEHRPLGEVAAEFNRYGSIPVEIEDAALRALPVSGMFDAGDTASFVAFLQTLPGVRIERTPKQIRVLKVTPTL